MNRGRAALLLAVALLPSAVWIFADRSVWRWDQAMYGEESVRLWASHGLAWLHAGRFKPPAVVWLGSVFVPLGRALGPVEAGLLLGVVLTQALTLVVCYRTCLRLFPEQRMLALIGAASVAASPLFVAMSHQLFSEPLQLLAAAYVFWIAAGADRMRAGAIVAHLVLAGALGLAAKTSTPIYCLLPAAYAVLASTRRPREMSRGDRWILAAGVALLGVTVAWYAANFTAVRQHVVAAMSAEVGYGEARPFVVKLWIWSVAMLRSLVSLPLWLLFLVWRRRPARNRLAIASLVQCAYAVLLFSLNVVEETRYLLALAPSVMVVFVWVASAVPRPRIVLGACVAQWALVYAVAFGLAPGLRGAMNGWLQPPETDATRKGEVERLAAATSGITVIGVELPWLNADSTAFYAAKDGRPAQYTSLGYAATDLVRALTRLRDLQPDFFVSLDEPPEADFLNRLDAPALQWMRRNPYYAQVPFESRLHVIVFAKRK